MGLESVSSTSLQVAGKGFNDPADYPRLVTALHARGIALQACFVFGLDDDTPDVFLDTARFAVRCGIDLPRFAIVTPFPGTRLYRQLEAEGRILTRDWQWYDGQHAVFQPARMTVDELQRGTEIAWKYAYSWGNIARRLRRSPAAWHLALMTNAGYRYYANHLQRFYSCDAMTPLLASGNSRPGRRPAVGSCES